jgi:hypothetical protein
MLAYLSLASEPAQVQHVCADRVMLKTNRSYAPGLQMVIELLNDARSFKCILTLQVDDIQSNPEGGYTLDAVFCRPLTAEELRNLVAE